MPRAKRIAVALGALVLGCALMVGHRLSQYVHAPFPTAVPRLAVPKGAGLTEVSRALQSAGVAPWRFGTEWGFRLWGRPRAVKAGIYAFQKGARLVDVFADLEAGRVDLVNVTFPEGFTAREMAVLLEKGDVTRAEDFVGVVLDEGAAKRWGLPGGSLEGFLFPDTYRFPREVPAKLVVDAMVRRFRDVSGELDPGGRGGDRGLLDWVTLASIVEKETGVSSERPFVAAVFHNRLRVGMRLQSDPTVIYGLPSFDGNLRKRDLTRASPYNTYVLPGLPKGPIANPGRASLEAAMRPAPVPYLYFVSRNDGTHLFSETYAEHRRAVNRYQKRGRS